MASLPDPLLPDPLLPDPLAPDLVAADLVAAAQSSVPWPARDQCHSPSV
ncbi:hypothetical protein [uncultured Erythrobacter sp.]|nr:hypothetical protein [uncultured Erythrobacter sp.]